MLTAVLVLPGQKDNVRDISRSFPAADHQGSCLSPPLSFPSCPRYNTALPQPALLLASSTTPTSPHRDLLRADLSDAQSYEDVEALKTRLSEAHLSLPAKKRTMPLGGNSKTAAVADNAEAIQQVVPPCTMLPFFFPLTPPSTPQPSCCSFLEVSRRRGHHLSRRPSLPVSSAFLRRLHTPPLAGTGAPRRPQGAGMSQRRGRARDA